MRISDWSSDVCSSDLRPRRRRLGDTPAHQALRALDLAGRGADGAGRVCHRAGQALPCQAGAASCREGNGGSRMTTTSRRPRLAVVIGTVCFLAFLALLFYGVRQRSDERRVGKSVSVRVDLGGRRIIKTTIRIITRTNRTGNRYYY